MWKKNPDQNPISLQINFFRKHTLKLNHQIATKSCVNKFEFRLVNNYTNKILIEATYFI